MATTKVTRKGQVTIPAEIRQKLELREGDVLTVHEEDGKVILEHPLLELQRAQAAITSYTKHIPPLEPEQIRELAARYIAEEVAQSMADERSSEQDES